MSSTYEINDNDLSLAIGSIKDLSPDELQDIVERIQLLRKWRSDGKLTDDAYQAKLRSISGQILSVRERKKSVHFQPARNKNGTPIQPPGGKPSLAGMPPVQSASFRRESVPPIDLKASLDALFDEQDESPANSPPVHFSPVEDQKPKSSGKANLVDWTQMLLDAVGVIDPTPIADLTNAGISSIRAITDPRRAPEHISNAITSVVSAVPYAGDIAKIFKYGGKGVAAAAGGAGRGGLVSLAQNLFGDGGGDGGGGGGGGGGGTVVGNPGGAAGGGGGGGIAAFGASLKSIIGTFGLAAAAAYGLVRGMQALTNWIDSANKKIIESNRELAQYNGGLATSYMGLDSDRINRSVERAEELRGPLSRLTKSQSRFEKAQQDLSLPYEKVALEFQNFKTALFTKLIEGINSIDLVGDAIDGWFGKEVATLEARNVIEQAWMDRMNIKPENKLDKPAPAAPAPGPNRMPGFRWDMPR